MGTHGRSGVDKIRFGSVAEAVLRQSTGAVLTVGPGVEPVDTVDIKRIVCPVDLSAGSELALKYAAGLARDLEARLSVIYVPASGEPADTDRHMAELCEWVPEDVRAGCDLHEIVRHGHLVEQILGQTRELSAGLIVISVSHHLFTDDTLGESTTEILRNAPCPVITAPAIS
jgi:nucleotide-binding universal stress UspA family protein